MEQLQFSTTINAPREIVWKNLWEDQGYRKWTSAFGEGSYAESTWEEGSPIKFLSPKGGGMYAIIKEHIPMKLMTFEHQGEIVNGEVQAREWAGSKESYELKDTEGGTEVVVTMDSTEEFASYFSSTFPKAFEILKNISEEEVLQSSAS
jgi:uncharacterized protein YndB with AHSA1/START domain